MSNLIIDASVAMQSGSARQEPVKHVCKPCRDFLKSCINSDCKVAFSQALSAEWREHSSSYARKWRVSMHAKRRVLATGAPDIPGLEKRISAAMASPKEKEAVEKDLHLVLAAIDVDGHIVSLDEVVRKLFLRACLSVVELTSLVWVNPDKASEQPIQWAIDGYKRDKIRTFGVLSTALDSDKTNSSVTVKTKGRK